MNDASAAAHTTVRHPRATLLVPAVCLFPAVVEGRWGQVAAVCEQAAPGSIRAAGTAADQLDGFAAGIGLAFGSVPALGYTSEPGAVTFHGTAAQTIQVLHLFQRVLLGQWGEVARVARRYADNRIPHDVESAMCGLRMHWAAEGAFPDQAGASEPISAACLPARVAYHAWKQLGGRVGGGPTFPLPDGPLTVETNAPLTSAYLPAF